LCSHLDTVFLSWFSCLMCYACVPRWLLNKFVNQHIPCALVIMSFKSSTIYLKKLHLGNSYLYSSDLTFLKQGANIYFDTKFFQTKHLENIGIYKLVWSHHFAYHYFYKYFSMNFKHIWKLWDVPISTTF
jgi:hypothetical protein